MYRIKCYLCLSAFGSWLDNCLSIKDNFIYAVSTYGTITRVDARFGVADPNVSFSDMQRLDLKFGDRNPTIYTKGVFLNSQGRAFTWSRGKITEYEKRKKLKRVSVKSLLALDLEFNVERPPQPPRTLQELLDADSDTEEDEFEVNQVLFNVVGIQIIQDVFVVCYLVNNFRMENCTIKLAFVPRNGKPGNAFCFKA